MAVMLASELEAAEAAQRQLAVRCEAQAAEIGEIGLQAEELRAALAAADEVARAEAARRAGMQDSSVQAELGPSLEEQAQAQAQALALAQEQVRAEAEAEAAALARAEAEARAEGAGRSVERSGDTGGEATP